MDYEKLGRRIREERLLRRMTLANLAEMTDKSINFIGQIERAEAKPSLETLVDIANALGTNVDTLLHDSRAAAGDALTGEITALLGELSDAGKAFLLEVIRQYILFHSGKDSTTRQ
ncbi:MAG: helix-turn-helix domain-containing protein [bacterium]